ncbi:hypothetical protein SCP_0205810 [Sparassis crispa]|uniref:WDR59/RTC1-like RING zinc finger domain-containing protein n=1 Tax=Sparassis crispa TaxID=139825 RepID=A0A401GB73_9APHY|nr:hypothetical protein SCP_0205810 [Sparassis crispa]GBE79383.1 hypothetical protein SCP_0205810 [Sparassis crispa]
MSGSDWSDVLEPSSPEDGSNFRRSLQIDMKGLVGDAVGNMSISPGSRDVVLAARKGLFIIDLEAPLNVPRFLPQGGTWDVADVQWNPHLTRSEYIVSTSNEKLLIWNLLLGGKTSIEHVLRSHYRAITDINWHTTDPDVVVSTGIDSWLWAWDLRTPQKPVMGLCAFGSGGTQVKWNRQDGNLLASSHLNEVFLWDRRKGSLPVSRIKAHNAKIYGIDWAHGRRNEIVTCSLDKTIKIWDTQTSEPKITIRTRYPVWRARDLPFGRGVLSLPQRGETALELFAHEDCHTPIETFEGHTDVVKEFVWRKGGQDGSEFQLITWSKDKTLRFWPMDIERAGTTPTPQSIAALSRREELKVSFSNPPTGTDFPPALSAPVGHRAILAEIRAPFPPRAARTSTAMSHAKATARSPEEELNLRSSMPRSRPVLIAHGRGGTMTRGHVGGRSAQINTFAWLSSVKVGGTREGSSGPGSSGENGTASRLESRSRPPSLPGRSNSQPLSGTQRSSDARDNREDDHREGEPGQSLQDEITSVINKLTTSKVKLEKADLTKKRTCTFGLHGPWGDSTSVFIRVSFTFPRDYPQAAYPHGIPMVDLERNPLISMNSRAFILRRLRAIRERQRPCLEKCLRFLLVGDDNGDIGRHIGSDSESSSEDEVPAASRKYRDLTYSLLRSDKNLAEPRTSQGVFGVNGELVCFFRAPPRIVRNPMQEISVSPSIASRGQENSPRLFQSPALLSDAVRHLRFAAHDRETEDTEVKRPEDVNNILRIMSNLFTFSQHKPMRVSASHEDIPTNYSLLPTRRSTVFIKKTPSLVGIDTAIAQEYELTAADPADLCKKNAEIARLRGRVDHERVFKLIEPVIANASTCLMNLDELSATTCSSRGSLAIRLVDKLYKELAATKDIQMLAMMSVLLLWTSTLQSQSDVIVHTDSSRLYAGVVYPQKLSLPDPSGRNSYQTRRNQSFSPIWTRPSPSPTFQPLAPPLSSPSSSRGSWSSLFNASSMRQLVAGSRTGGAVPVPVAGKLQRGFSSPSQGYSKEFLPPTSPTTKSWSEATNISDMMSAVAFSSAGHPRRPTFSQVLSTQPTPADKRKLVLNLVKTPQHLGSLQSQLRNQLLCHTLVYAEMLLAWELPDKRNELLKLIEGELVTTALNPLIVENTLVLDQLGQAHNCEQVNEMNSAASVCASRSKLARCTICRIPVKGLSFICPVCLHVTHVACWEARRSVSCATGCGCQCTTQSNKLLADVLSLSPLWIASTSIR